MTIKKYTYLIFVFALIFTSCSRTFDEKLADYIEQNFNDFSPYKSIVDLNSVTDFEWDSVFVFGGLTTFEEINEAIGIDCKCKAVKDNYTRIVFLHQGEIVHESQYHSLGEKVQFRIFDKENDTYIHYTQETSKSYVLKKKKNVVEGYFYDLYPVGGTMQPKYKEGIDEYKVITLK